MNQDKEIAQARNLITDLKSHGNHKGLTGVMLACLLVLMRAHLSRVTNKING